MFMTLSPCDGTQLSCSHHFVPMWTGTVLFLFIAAHAFETCICATMQVNGIQIAKSMEKKINAAFRGHTLAGVHAKAAE